MVDGIIFDMDGVLVDSERQSNEGWKWAAKKQGIDMPMWLIDSFKGAPDELNRKMFDDYFDGKADYSFVCYVPLFPHGGRGIPCDW